MNISLKDEGIVINKREYGEADRLITIFTKEHGKLVTIMKGIRKSKKREVAATDIAVMSDIIFYERKEKLYISSIESKKVFLNISSDIFKISLLFYIFKALDIFIQEKQKNDRIYNMIIKFVEFLEREKDKEKMVISVLYIIFKILKIEGFIYEISGIGNQLNMENFEFTEEYSINSIRLGESEKKVLEYLNKVDIEGINGLKLKVKDIIKIIEIFEKFIENNTNEKLKIKFFLREDL